MLRLRVILLHPFGTAEEINEHRYFMIKNMCLEVVACARHRRLSCAVLSCLTDLDGFDDLLTIHQDINSSLPSVPRDQRKQILFILHNRDRNICGPVYRMSFSTVLYALPSRYRRLLRNGEHACTKPIIPATNEVPQCSKTVDSTTFTTIATTSVSRAESGIDINSSSTMNGRAGARISHAFIIEITTIAAMNRPSAQRCNLNQLLRLKLKFVIHIPFVHIGFRYGGPILNTAATRMY